MVIRRVSRPRRARGEAAKQQRRDAILRVARRLFERGTFADLTMAELARRAGLAKGTVYLYFETKEELFLAVLEDLLQAWFDDVDRRLDGLGGKASPERVARGLADAVAGQETLTRLLTVLHTSLEHNITRARVLRFKQLVHARLFRTAARLERCLPFLRPGEGARVLLLVDALVIGLRHLADPAPVVREVLDEPGMDVFDVDFVRELRASLLALLRGLEAQAGKDRR